MTVAHISRGALSTEEINCWETSRYKQNLVVCLFKLLNIKLFWKKSETQKKVSEQHNKTTLNFQFMEFCYNSLGSGIMELFLAE